MRADPLTPAEVLRRIPQQPPFRFIDEIHEIDENHIVASYRYRTDELFYAGHFPGNPVTPGVVLLETIAQAGVVALGIYLTAQAARVDPQRLVTLFTDTEAEFHQIVRPGERVVVHARKIFFRRQKLRVEASMRREDGELVCSGQFAGMGVFTS